MSAAAAVEVDQPLSNNPAKLARNALRVKSALLTKKPESKSVSIAPTSSNPDPASSQLNESDNSDSDRSDSDRSVELQTGQFEGSKSRPGTDELLDPAPATHRDLTMTRSQAPSQARNTNTRNALISETGREFGPDIALKVGPNIDNAEFKLIINENSSITEVLNILAFLLNNGQQRKGSVIDKFSYNDNESFEKVYNSLKDSAPFNITTLTTTLGVSEGEEITIPRTILKRNNNYDLKDDITIKSNEIQPLISACILQMINILENTREVFGGWAKLFKGMQGGSSKSKTKKTRRRY
jgi:hypothetical protein